MVSFLHTFLYMQSPADQKNSTLFKITHVTNIINYFDLFSFPSKNCAEIALFIRMILFLICSININNCILLDYIQWHYTNQQWPPWIHFVNPVFLLVYLDHCNLTLFQSTYIRSNRCDRTFVRTWHAHAKKNDFHAEACTHCTT